MSTHLSQKIIRRSDIFDYLSLMFSGTILGGILVHRLDNYSFLQTCFSLGLAWCSIERLSRGRAADQARHAQRLDALRYRGLYPPEGEESDEWVKRLKEAGEQKLASEMHLRLHPGRPLRSV